MPLTPSQHHHQLGTGEWKRLIAPSRFTCATSVVILLLQIPLISGNPHAPQKLAWQVISQTGDIAWSTSSYQPPWTWCSTLYPNLCNLETGLETWDIPGTYAHGLKCHDNAQRAQETGFGCGNKFYLCMSQRSPHQSTRVTCGGDRAFLLQEVGL